MKNKEKTIYNDDMVEFSSFFKNAVKQLNISPVKITSDTTNLSSPVVIVIKKFEKYSSVSMIKEHICVVQDFDFEQESMDYISKG